MKALQRQWRHCRWPERSRRWRRHTSGGDGIIRKWTQSTAPKHKRTNPYHCFGTARDLQAIGKTVHDLRLCHSHHHRHSAIILAGSETKKIAAAKTASALHRRALTQPEANSASEQSFRGQKDASSSSR